MRTPLPLLAYLCVLSATLLRGEDIYITNGSFETPVYVDGNGEVTVTSGTYDSWVFETNGGQFGIINPDDSRIAGTSGPSGFLPAPAQGYQYGVLGAAGGHSSSIENISPLATISAGTNYSLSVAAGNEETNQFTNFQGMLNIALLAGNTGVATDDIQYSTIPKGTFEDFTTTFSSDDDPTAVGASLNLRITFTAGSMGDNGIFDNVQVSALPVPEPSTYAMVLVGFVGLLLGRRFKYR